MTEHYSLPDIKNRRSLLFVFLVLGVGCRVANSDRAFVPDDAIFDVAGFTISLSVFPYSIPDDRQIGFVDNDLQYAVLIENNRLLCNDGNRSVEGQVPPANQWSTIVCTSDQSKMRLYTNGMLIDELSIDSARELNNNPIAIANMSPGFDQPFLGLLDNLRVWGRGLTPMEVAELDN